MIPSTRLTIEICNNQPAHLEVQSLWCMGREYDSMMHFKSGDLPPAPERFFLIRKVLSMIQAWKQCHMRSNMDKSDEWLNSHEGVGWMLIFPRCFFANLFGFVCKSYFDAARCMYAHFWVIAFLECLVVSLEWFGLVWIVSQWFQRFGLIQYSFPANLNEVRLKKYCTWKRFEFRSFWHVWLVLSLFQEYVAQLWVAQGSRMTGTNQFAECTLAKLFTSVRIVAKETTNVPDGHTQSGHQNSYITHLRLYCWCWCLSSLLTTINHYKS